MKRKDVKNVLVVEDELDVQIFLKTVLEDAGFAVDIADNGKHGLERIKLHKPDLISLDLVMPRMRGVTFIKYLQQNPEWATIPVIVVTAHAYNHAGKEDVLKLKAEKSITAPHAFLDKPIDPVEYITTIRNILHLENDGYPYPRRADRSEERRLNVHKLEEALKTIGDYR